MKTPQIQLAIKILQKGGIIAYPTEAVFGLGCDPLNEMAVMRLLALKQRSVKKGLILIASAWQQLESLVMPIAPARFNEIQKTWPGPHTWVFPASPKVPKWICGEHNTVAVRITAHPIAKALCKMFGKPLVSTSANIAAQAPARTVQEVEQMFPQGIDLIINGDLGNLKQPTSIRDAITGKTLRI